MSLMLDLKIKVAALKVLFKEVEFYRMSLLGLKLLTREAKGEPYKGCPEPKDQKDKDSRKLIGEGVVLYRVLLDMYPQEKAEKIIRKVIINCAVAQLRVLIPPLKKTDLEKLTPEERTKCYCDIISKFPNTDWELVKDTETEVGINVTKCRLVEIFDMCGHPELRDSCCTGDAIFFNKYQPEIAFSREQMIGKGCPYCDFCFALKEIEKETKN